MKEIKKCLALSNNILYHFIVGFYFFRDILFKEIGGFMDVKGVRPDGNQPLTGEKCFPVSESSLFLHELRFGSLKHLVPAFGKFLPLSIGIRSDYIARMRENGITDKSRPFLLSVLKKHTHGLAYLRHMSQKNASRYDLDGNETGKISEKHRRSAERQFAAMKSKLSKLAEKRKGEK